MCELANMKIFYSLILIALMASTCKAQVSKPPLIDEDCGCNPVLSIEGKNGQKTVAAKTTTPASVQDVIDANSKILNQHLEEQKKIDEKEAWEVMLSKFATLEKASLLVDMGTHIYMIPPSLTLDKAFGPIGMRALAKSSFKTWRQSNGIQVFSRTRGLPTTNRQKAAATIVGWVKGTDKATLKQLIGTGVIFSRAPNEVQNAVIDLLNDRDNAFLFLKQADKTVISLNKEPFISASSPDKRKRLNLPVTWPTPPLLVKTYNPTVMKEVPETATEVLEPPINGELNFGKGSILRLRDILDKAAAVFGKPIDIDRPDETLFFISGSYTATSLNAALELTKTESDFRVDPDPQYKKDALNLLSDLLQSDWKDYRESQVDITWMRGGIVGNVLNSPEEVEASNKMNDTRESIPASYFIEGATGRASDLTGDRFGLRSFLRDNQIEDDTEVTLSLDLVMHVATAGKHEMGGMFDVHRGKVVPHMQDNRDSFSLLLK